jgi:hypothetical protein
MPCKPVFWGRQDLQKFEKAVLMIPRV